MEYSAIATCSVVFEPSGIRGNIEKGTTVMQAAISLGADLKNLCGSSGLCGKCRVIIREADSGNNHASTAQPVSPMGPREKEFFLNNPRLEGFRLACLTEITGDAVIYIPDESRNESQVIHKHIRGYSLPVDPDVVRYEVATENATVSSTCSCHDAFTGLLREQHGISPGTGDLAVLRDLHHFMYGSHPRIAVYIDRANNVVHIGDTGDGKMYYGIAIDVGTTSLAGYLCDLSTGNICATASLINPQVQYGEDVITRIVYAITETEGSERLHKEVIRGINEIISRTAADAGIDAAEIVDMTFVGNTFMHHSTLGLDTSSLGTAPFCPRVTSPMSLKARDLGIRISPGANVHALPAVSSFIGSDTIGVILADINVQKGVSALIIDIGTNGELVLWDGRQFFCTSCATGPALEGATILHGMRGAPGAIEKVEIDPESGDVRFKVIGSSSWSDEGETLPARGICGSGIIDTVSQLFQAGILKKNGRFNTDSPLPRLQVTENGPQYVIAYSHENARDEDIIITIDDVRAVQLAKGALYAAAKLLMQHAGISVIDNVMIAGSFGSVIDKYSAAAIGLYPDCAADDVQAIGNAAGYGAIAALLDYKRRNEARRIAEEINYVELTSHELFEREFAMAMHFPHMKDKFEKFSRIRTACETVIPE